MSDREGAYTAGFGLFIALMLFPAMSITHFYYVHILEAATLEQIDRTDESLREKYGTLAVERISKLEEEHPRDKLIKKRQLQSDAIAEALFIGIVISGIMVIWNNSIINGLLYLFTFPYFLFVVLPALFN